MPETSGLRRHARTSASCLYLRRGLSFDDWLIIGRQILRLSSASAWWLGDWLVYGARAYRERYTTALESTPLEYQTLRNYAWVARRVSMSRRRDNLSFQHHAEVAPLSPAEQDLWLDRASERKWSRNELRRQIAASRNLGPGAEGREHVTLRLKVAQRREQTWREAADAAQLKLSEWVAAAADDAAQAGLGTRPPGAPPAEEPSSQTRHRRHAGSPAAAPA